MSKEMKKISISLARLMVVLAAVLMIIFNTINVNAEEAIQDSDYTIVSAGEKDGEQKQDDQNKDDQNQDDQKQEEQNQEEQKQEEQKQEEQKQAEPQQPTGKDQWMNSNGQWWYKLANGSWVVGWKQIDGKWYYFDNNGYMKTGWVSVSNVWYYMNSAGDMATGWVNEKGTWYYMGKSGILTTGWIQSGNKWYFMKNSGAMATRWAKDEVTGKWYYFKDNGEMSVGWCHDGSNWYYMDKSGEMKTGWVSEGGKWYFMKDSGAMVWDDWASASGYWYHFDKSGVMQTGKFTDKDGTVYDLGASGGVADFTAQKAQQYSSNTNYLIMVDRTAHKVYIFQGRQGNWTTLKEFSCTDGVSTPNGTFQIGIHNYHFGEEKGYTCWYATQISGEILFHSALYAKNSMTTITDGRLGIRASHGCIRLDINNAKYIYENIPQGTKVVIYE